MYKVFCPYRICPLGAHVDHQKGFITGFAIDKGINFDYEITDDGKIELTSSDFEGVVSFSIDGLLELQSDWGNYMRGATKIMRDNYQLTKGIKGHFKGELPIGGLSSSAAVTLCFLRALSTANDIKLTDSQMIDYAYLSESDFVGLKIGKLDQSCEVLCKKNQYLFLDTLDMSYKLIKENPNHTPYEFLIIHSGQARKLVNSAYNVRVDECKSAAYLAKALLGKEYGKYKDTYLRDLTFEEVKKVSNFMPINWMRRAEHYYGENQRVLDGIKAWEKGDMVKFGEIVRESGNSSINLYEAGSPLLKDLNFIINSTDGVYGGRFMGGGFNGCCLAIIDPSKKEEIKNTISTRYLTLHPEMKELFGMFDCVSGDGIGE